MNPYLALGISILSEIVATLSLKAADGFSRPGPVILVLLGYGTAFYLMSSALRDLPVGLVYAVWSSIGMVGAALGGVILFGERFTPLMIAGVVVIALGIVLLASGQMESR